jgi:hypothetical protein
MRWAVLGIVGALGLGIGGNPPGGEGPCLYLFISPDAPGAGDLARRAVEFVKITKGAVTLRPVLLVGDFRALGGVEAEGSLAQALVALGGTARNPLDISLYDEEGLDLARRWGITRVPALVLVRDGRAHRAMGSGTRPEDLWECR